MKISVLIILVMALCSCTGVLPRTDITDEQLRIMVSIKQVFAPLLIHILMEAKAYTIWTRPTAAIGMIGCKYDRTIQFLCFLPDCKRDSAVYWDEDCVAFLDPHPINAGHTH